MNIKIDFKEPSTLRGAVWVIIFFIGMVMSFTGKDVEQLLLLGAGVAGAIGVGVKDEK